MENYIHVMQLYLLEPMTILWVKIVNEMKIVALAMARDEELNIERFCRSYSQIADLVLIADGGSVDKTVNIAKKMPKTKVRHFAKRIQLENGYWRNPKAAHINFLVAWGIREGADWLLFDDMDCTPNQLLKRDGRRFLEETPYDNAYAVRLYLWGEDYHFPNLAQPIERGRWETSLWGWKTSVDMKFLSEIVGLDFTIKRMFDNRLNIMPPYCLLHRPWPNEEVIQKKLDFYRNSGQIPNMKHPKEFGGSLEELPVWAKD